MTAANGDLRLPRMARPSRKPVARYHDRVAHCYDDIYDDDYWRWHDTLTWEYLKPHLPAGQLEPIIDLGCGTGKWGLRIAGSGYHVTCLDISPKMVDEVRRKSAELGLTAHIECCLGDLENLGGLREGHYRLATALGEPLCCVPSPPRALKQISRILQPGGVLVGTIDNSFHAVDYFLERSDVAGLARFLESGTTHWLTRQAEERFPLKTYTPAQVAKLLTSAGFKVVEVLGKTVLPMRHYRALLEDHGSFKKLLAIERKLARLADAAGRAAHIQFAARKPALSENSGPGEIE